MKLLLDTHIWLWSLLEPERLSKTVAKTLTSTKAELWLSPVSVWEFLLLVERRRIKIASDPNAWLATALEQAPMSEASLTFAVATQSRKVRLSHQDPADRFIAATAQVYDLTLVTDDEHLLRGEGFRKLANR
jgi:PIN domain nuclease of toxin-antitoxin system